MTDFIPAQTGLSRVFLIEGRARPDHEPVYKSCMRMQGVSQSFGDVTKIECPHPTIYDEFVEIGSIRGADERATATLEGRYALDLASDLLRLARNKCPADVQVHFGDCEDPSDFNDFKKALILEDAVLTAWNSDDLGSFASDDRSMVNENAPLSVREVYESLDLGYGEKGGSVVVNEIIDAVVAGHRSCGSCVTENDGCYKILMTTLSSGASPATNPDLIYSIDKGQNWHAHDIDSISGGEDGDGVAKVGQYVVVVSNGTGSLHHMPWEDIDGLTDPTFTEVTTGFVGAPNDIWSLDTIAFIVGDSGYIYSVDDPTEGVTVLDAGAAVSDDLNAVKAVSSKVAVAVGENGAVVRTTNGTEWAAVTRPVGAGVHLTCVALLDKNTFIVGTDGGALWYTTDGGTTWTSLTFPGSGTGVVRDIAFATRSVLWLAHDTTTPTGRILQSIDGGQSWKVMPRGSGSFPAVDRITALAVCGSDVNFVAGGGLADDGSDGVIIVGDD